ncbi:asparagine synthase-related protein [Vibrio breoganii]|uniref:asparagine synthase-related protein n=1 Tax=Vibrio breoganii TaxID=553239 RepID=UPI0002F06E54|nr:asparagine synthase-related protein [Vibrio breoganii]OEF81410.1 hypothetical protein B003_12575 [Vibrio breoganii 1C10]
MPGLFGFVKDSVNNIDTMANAINNDNDYELGKSYEDEYITASKLHLNNDISPKSRKLDNYHIWIDGEAYNLSSVLNELNYNATFDLAEALVFAYSKNELNEILNRLDGYFSAILYDFFSREVHLISDRNGMRLLYYYVNNNKFVWSSEIKGILALDGIDKAINKNSFNCFVDLGYLLADNTWFKNIRLLDPATVMTYSIDSGTITKSRYWDWKEYKSLDLTFEEAVDELGLRILKSIEKRSERLSKVGVAISGGLDSRAIFAGLNYLHDNFKGFSYTFGMSGCVDIKIAKQILMNSKWNYKEYNFSGDHWFNSRIKSIWNTDGMQDMKHMHGVEFLDDLTKYIEINLNGYGGGLLTGELIDKNNYNCEQAIKSKFGSDYFYLVDKDYDFYSDNYEAVIYMNRNRRCTNMGTVNFLNKIHTRKPFMDNEIVALLMGIPKEYRKDNRLYSTMLKKYFPDYFKVIPWQRTGKPVAVDDFKNIPSRVINKIKRDTKRVFGIKSLQEYTDYNCWIRTKLVSEQLSSLLRYESSFYQRFTSVDFVDKYLQPHLESRFVDNSDKILRIATIELYFKKVFESEKRTD